MENLAVELYLQKLSVLNLVASGIEFGCGELDYILLPFAGLFAGGGAAP
jgi:hypothetical protein